MSRKQNLRTVSFFITWFLSNEMILSRFFFDSRFVSLKESVIRGAQGAQGAPLPSQLRWTLVRKPDGREGHRFFMQILRNPGETALLAQHGQISCRHFEMRRRIQQQYLA